MKRRVRNLLAVTVSLAIICLCLVVLSAAEHVLAETLTEDGIICDGIYIDQVSLAGMNQQEAEDAVGQYIKDRRETPVHLTVEGDDIDTTLEELGYTYEKNDFIEQALNYGQSGNIIERYKAQEDVKNKNIVYEMHFSVDKEGLEEFVTKNCKKYESKPVNAKISMGDEGLEVSDSKEGISVNYDATVSKLKSAIEEQEWTGRDIEVEAVVDVVQPEVTREQCEKCKDVLGTFKTYAGYGGNRVANIENATRLINGTVVYPGETFSTEKTIVPFTEENGYFPAGAYSQGQVIDELGGGVCQVSTTLYNAVLLSELEVVERAPHSMIVTYVKPSMDAAIAEGYKDFKFKNNTDVPIYIEGYNSGGYINFTIYGEETRDLENRKVEYVSETLETIQPGKDVITKDPTQPKSYKKVTQSAHIGYKATLWKVVTVNGKEESREQINYSFYSASPNYITVGTKEDDKSPKPSGKPDEGKTPEPSKKPDPTQKPKPTQEPEPSQEPEPTDEPDPFEEPVG